VPTIPSLLFVWLLPMCRQKINYAVFIQKTKRYSLSFKKTFFKNCQVLAAFSVNISGDKLMWYMRKTVA